MNDLVTFLVGAFAVVAIIMFMCWGVLALKKAMLSKGTSNDPEYEPKTEEQMPYKAAKLLTQKEYAFFKALQPIAQKHNLLICPKVRLADLVEIPKSTPNYMRWFGYVKSKHVDFVLCDINLNVKLIIEVDDITHDKPDRQKRDQFIDTVFQTVNMKILHIRQWGTELEQTITETLNITNAPNVPLG